MEFSEKERIEYLIRYAELYIMKAKNCLLEEYDNYEDIQKWMHNMEAVRLETETLLSKYLKGTLT